MRSGVLGLTHGSCSRTLVLVYLLQFLLSEALYTDTGTREGFTLVNRCVTCCTTAYMNMYRPIPTYLTYPM